MEKKLTVGSLFAGIGGFDLGFERAGFEIKWQVEIDDYCSRVLAKHWPHVRRYGDIRAIDWTTVEPVDVVCGGFPCQPHSTAGERLASADDRDLWGEFARAIRALRPKWVVAENVIGLLSSESGRFVGRVLRDLAESGFDAEWDCIPARAIGANHQRDRVWIVAYANGERELQPQGGESHQRRRTGDSGLEIAGGIGLQESRGVGSAVHPTPRIFGQADHAQYASWWAVEPAVGRVAHGVPARVDRLRGLGNAVVPQIPEWIAHRIKEAEGLAA